MPIHVLSASYYREDSVLIEPQTNEIGGAPRPKALAHPPTPSTAVKNKSSIAPEHRTELKAILFLMFSSFRVLKFFLNS